MGSCQGLVFAATAAVMRYAAVLVAALAAAGCLEVNLSGELRSNGAFVGTAELDVPLKARLDAELGPIVAGPERDIAASWRARGVTVTPKADDQEVLEVVAPQLVDLSLDWLAFEFTLHDGSYRYAHRVTLPPEVIDAIQARLEKWLQPLAHVSRHGEASPAALARGLVSTSQVVIDLDFPGPVTATDGERLSETRVRWFWDAEDLVAHARPLGYAYGRVPWWLPWWERLRDLISY